MNKLGFYIENTTIPFLRDALRQVKPPTILIHAQDRGLLHEIRRELSPDSFVIGRLFKTNAQQEAWLDSIDPVKSGRDYAEEIIRYDFGLATERSAGGHLLIDAWMGLNESLRGPASFPGFAVDDQFKRRAEAHDLFHDSFRQRLEDEGLGAVAFNFAAGNFTRPEHYLDWFPRNLAGYTYLGFHEYGWPSLKPGPGVETSALFYRRCMAGINQHYGGRHKAIITELGLTMAYGHPANPDHGWLNGSEPLAQDEYWDALNWYNAEILVDHYVLGGCLFQVGHTGRWVSFRHLGEDSESRAITIINRIEDLANDDTVPPPPPPVDLSLAERIDQIIEDASTARTKVAGLSDRASVVQQRLTPLAPQAKETHAVELLTAELQTRLTQAQTKLNDLKQRVDDPGSEGLTAAQGRLTDLSAQFHRLQSQVNIVSDASRRFRVIEQMFTGQLQEARGAELLGVDLRQIHDEGLALRELLPQ